MKTYLIYLVLAVCSSYSYSQTLTGTLLSKDNKESIPFATIRIGDNYGVISNTEGQFSIVVNQFTQKDSLEFSSMGFETKYIAIGDYVNEQTVLLTTAVNELGEVFLKDNQLSGRELIDKFINNYKENYASEANSYTIFTRNKYKSKYKDFGFEVKKANYLSNKVEDQINDDLKKLSESIIGNTTTYFTEKLVDFHYFDKDTTKLMPNRAIKLSSNSADKDLETIQNQAFKKIFEKLENTNTFKLKTFIITLQDSLDLSEINKELEEKPDTLNVKSIKNGSKSVLDRYTFNQGLPEPLSEPDDYNFTIDEVTSFNNEMVYVVSYQPDRGRAKYFGKFYITAKNYAIVKLTKQLAEGKSESKLNLKFLFGIKFDAYFSSREVIYFKNQDGKYYPKYIKALDKQYFYLDRKFVFKENNDDRSKRIKFKLDILAEADNIEEREFLIVQQNPLTKEGFSAIPEPKPVIVEEFKNYSPNIWKEQNVLQATKEIKDY